jgi:predicted flavoprotein YhiN
MVPFFDNEQLKQELDNRKKLGYSPEEILTGILPNKFGIALKDLFDNDDTDTTVYSLKNRRFKIKGTKSWNEAEFTAGGINLNEIDPNTLESKKHNGIYFAGEILDVNGKRGGYNLGWAWASGFVTGKNA